MSKSFFKHYSSEILDLLKLDNKTILKLEKVKNFLKIIKKNKKKVLIFGNGGSAAIANHFTIDLIKNTKIRCLNFNDSSTLTCLSNDFGYENWVKKSLEYYADKGDMIIIISSSGESKNMTNACKYALKKKFLPLITLTGFKKGNTVSKLGNINFWINSKKYNHVENSHQFLLLSLVDSLAN
jgi:D-sedoheptulose 7-phosphate isomerase